MTSPPALVNPRVLQWAREIAGFSIDEAASKIGVAPERLARAEVSEGELTIRQAEVAARVYERPVATFFLPKPPDEKSPEAEHRQLPDSPPPPWPRALKSLIRRIRERQRDALDVYALLDAAPPWATQGIELDTDAERAADNARRALRISLDLQKSWRDRTGFVPLRNWIDAIENMGVLVVQDGSVPIEVARGLASVDDRVPTIVVNTKDDARARVFTLLHEFGHQLRFELSTNVQGAAETWCNRFAAQLLMPSGAFRPDFDRLGPHVDLLVTVDELALAYGVTGDAAAVRLGTLRLLPHSVVDDLRGRIAERSRMSGANEAGGGDYYKTTIGRLSPSFTGLVFSALDEQALSLSEASSLLGVKVNHLPRLRDEIGKRQTRAS